MLVAVLMLVASVSAFAESDADVTQNTPDNTNVTDVARYDATAGTANLKLDGSLKITKLEKDDEIALYKIVGWDDTNGWSFTDAYKTAATGYDPDAIMTAIKAGNVTYDTASAWAGMAANDTALTINPAKADASGEWTITNTEPGLYMALVTAKTAGVIYNPIILGNDYYKNDSSWITLADNGLSYGGEAVAKKQKIELTKDSPTIVETPVGSDATFEINTTIPKYPANYTKLTFDLYDLLSAGLALKADTIEVYAGENAEGTKLTSEQYTLDTTAVANSYTYKISFKEAYIRGLAAAQKIYVTYKATITGEVPQNVNPENNTVTLHYTNAPTDSTGSGRLKDRTNHYTFDIDGELLGPETWKTTEVVKVGLDKDGNEITETKEIHSGMTVGALQGAKFTVEKKNGEGNFAAYTNGKISDATNILSDADGRITLKGLAADIEITDSSLAEGQYHYQGVYKITETEAPAGYVKDPTPRYIIIDVITEDKNVTETVDSNEVTYAVETLKSYTVKVGASEAAAVQT